MSFAPTRKDGCRAKNIRPFYCCLFLATAMLLTGCSTAGRINAARENFYMSRFPASIENLQSVSKGDTASILALMERGMAYQLNGNYKESANDFVAAAELANELDYYSVGKGAASMVINDRVLNYSGAPYERTLLHAFAAQNFLAMSLWDDAAVEARNIADRLENLDGFPDDPFSHYLAGFCFEMINDSNGAHLEYKRAASLVAHLKINEYNGKITSTNAKNYLLHNTNDAELVCFIGIGRGPTEYGSWIQKPLLGNNPYVEIYANGQCLGRSYIFTSTHELMIKTQKKIAAMKAAKTVSRIAIKETISREISEKNVLLGELVRFLLFSLETTDTKRWETLPQWLQVARVPCPLNLSEYTLVMRGQNDIKISEITVKKPIVRKWKTYFSFYRFL